MKNGIINVLKPPGMTSSNVVSDIRRILGMKKVGHSGTLDPGAAGVLPILFGNATRLFDCMQNDFKEYIFEITFGKETDTLDSYGKIISNDDKQISRQELDDSLPYFLGEIYQIPPMYSAISVDGKKLYSRARDGEMIDLQHKKRKIMIYEMQTLKTISQNRFLLRVLCSKGTYVRVIAKDIANRLGTVAYVSLLIRTRTGKFELKDSYSIAELNELKGNGLLGEACEKLDCFFNDYTKAVVDSSMAQKLKNGNPIAKDYFKICQNIKDDVLPIFCNDAFVGLGRLEQDCLKITALLNDEFVG